MVFCLVEVQDENNILTVGLQTLADQTHFPSSSLPTLFLFVITRPFPSFLRRPNFHPFVFVVVFD